MENLDILKLIELGENEGVDFKREIRLDSREDKGEFVKDIISLANSAPNGIGYLLIGVNDNKTIFGLEILEEERIQQIIYNYTHPSITISCNLVKFEIENSSRVGVIQVKSNSRPYQVKGAIGRIRDGDVFVRRGSIITKATEDEITFMQRETAVKKDVGNLISAGDIHRNLNNYREAINSYSKALEIIPVANLFYSRGECYKLLMKSSNSSEKYSKELANRAYKDFSNAIRITDDIEIHKKSRLERIRIFDDISNHDFDFWEEDIEWLKKNVEGKDLGEVIYHEYWVGTNWGTLAYDEPDETREALTMALTLGYSEPELYELRAEANFHLRNYGDALKDIELALESKKNEKRVESLLSWKGDILFRMGRYQDALNSFRFGSGSHGYTKLSEDDVLWQLCINDRFGNKHSSREAKTFIQILLLRLLSGDVTRVELDGDKVVSMKKEPASKTWLEEEYSEIISILIEIVGEEFWGECENIARNGYWYLGFGSKK